MSKRNSAAGLWTRSLFSQTTPLVSTAGRDAMLATETVTNVPEDAGMIKAMMFRPRMLYAVSFRGVEKAMTTCRTKRCSQPQQS